MTPRSCEPDATPFLDKACAESREPMKKGIGGSPTVYVVLSFIPDVNKAIFIWIDNSNLEQICFYSAKDYYTDIFFNYYVILFCISLSRT